MTCEWCGCIFCPGNDYDIYPAQASVALHCGGTCKTKKQRWKARLRHRDAVCQARSRFPCERAALIGMDTVNSRDPEMPVRRVYQCGAPSCDGGWHMTSRAVWAPRKTTDLDEGLAALAARFPGARSA